MNKSDLLLVHQFTDRAGREVYNIHQPSGQHHGKSLGQMRMLRGVDQGPSSAPLTVDWDESQPEPDKGVCSVVFQDEEEGK